MNPETGKFDLFWAISVASLTLYSGLAYLFELSKGQHSDFYGAIAMSMSKSLSNWWWGAADPGGTITLDKIPGSYWIPALFVKVFGFSTWSVNAPNAIASIALVLVVAATGKLLAGRYAGLLAGAIVATTPILAAVARSNQPESYFLLWISVAAYFAVKATKGASFKHLMWAGVFIALAFHSYMLVAWAAWPALGLAWLTVNLPWPKKLLQLLAAGLSSLALSLVWILSVTLTPASARPYIGGSNTNSAFEMVFGYNGLGRFSALTSGTSAIRGFTPPFSGDPSFFRLVNSQLLPQIGWLIPAALVSIVVLLVRRGKSPQTWFVIAFFVVYAVMFSVVSGMHQFYTAEMGIGIALLIAQASAGAENGKHRFGPVVIVATAAITALFIAIQYSTYLVWAPVVQLLLAVVAVIFILVVLPGKAAMLTPIALVGALVFSPGAWAADVYRYPSNINPVAGPTNSMGMFGSAPGGGTGTDGENVDSALIQYLEKHQGKAKFLVAMFSTGTAAPYINATGENILPIGGFDGSDPSPTLAQIKALISAGDLKYVSMSSSGFGGGMAGGMAGGFGGGPGNSSASATSAGSTNSSAVRTWVEAHCKVSDYSSGSLYECSPSSVSK
ncbi:MAG: hypothetical protein RJA35_437 [Actinomycetota bacterium]